MREVTKDGGRWLVLDVKGISNDALLGMSENPMHTLSNQQEEAIAEVIRAGLQEEGIAAEIRAEVPPAPPGVFRLIIPTLRLYLPLKDASREFYAAVISAAFAHGMGAPPSAVGAGLATGAVAIFARRVQGLDEQELQIVTTVSVLNRQLGGPITNAQLRSHLGRDVESNTLRLSEKGVLRYVEGGWVIDF